MRGPLVLLCAGVLSATLLAGCGLFGRSDPDPTGPDGTSGPSTQEPTEAEGVRPEVLSAEILEASAAMADAEPVASVTTTFPAAGNPELTVDVLSVRRNESSTTVLMRWTGPADAAISANEPWYDSVRNRGGTRNLYLIDPAVTQSRYLPLSFDQVQQIGPVQCACPDLVMRLGADGILVSSTYAALPPEVETVDLVANDGWLTLTDIPVQD